MISLLHFYQITSEGAHHEGIQSNAYVLLMGCTLATKLQNSSTKLFQANIATA